MLTSVIFDGCSAGGGGGGDDIFVHDVNVLSCIPGASPRNHSSWCRFRTCPYRSQLPPTSPQVVVPLGTTCPMEYALVPRRPHARVVSRTRATARVTRLCKTALRALLTPSMRRAERTPNARHAAATTPALVAAEASVRHGDLFKSRRYLGDTLAILEQCSLTYLI